MESPFTLSAKPGTDIWKKPPSTDVFNAPLKSHSKAPLSHFRSASITFTTTYTTQYDQAGLLLSLINPSASSSHPSKWIKTGIEFYNRTPRLSTVCCDRFADWSVSPLPSNTTSSTDSADEVQAGQRSVTMLVERAEDELGLSLWVYHVAADGTKTPLREICWVFASWAESGAGEEKKWEVEVSALVARPNTEVKEVLEAKFEDFQVKWAEE